MGVNSDVYAADVNIDILSATVKDKRIEGVSVTLQRNGAQSVSGTTNASGSVNLGSTFADDQDALLIVKKEGYSNLVVKCSCAGMTGNDSNLLIVFYVQIMPDDFVMQLHRF